MARYKVVMQSRGQGRQAEFMVVGDTLEEALAGCKVNVYLMQRNRVTTDHKGEPCTPFCFDKRILVKMVPVGEADAELPF